MATTKKVRKARAREGAGDAPDVYLTVHDLCRRLKISPATAHRHLPKMRTVRFGRRVLIRVEDADAYAASLIREPAALPRRKLGYQRAAGAP
jgi:hypothetical protein